MTSPDKTLQIIPIDQIRPDPNQPRLIAASLAELQQQASQGELAARQTLEGIGELATSILETGLEQPITVYWVDDGYLIKHGQRRWLAVQLLGHETIECYVVQPELGQLELLLAQLNSNTQREDLNVFELARSAQKLWDHLKENGGSISLVSADGNVAQVELPPHAPDPQVWAVVEAKMGVKQSRRYQIMQVLKLPLEIQYKAERAGIAESRLRYVVPITDEEIRDQIIDEIAEQNPSNEAIKQRIKELEAQKAEQIGEPVPKPMQIEAAIKPIRKLYSRFRKSKNIKAQISMKDPRTVESYRKIISEVESAIDELKQMRDELKYLEE